MISDEQYQAVLREKNECRDFIKRRFGGDYDTLRQLEQRVSCLRHELESESMQRRAADRHVGYLQLAVDDFENEGLWHAVRRVVRRWCGHGGGFEP